MKITEISIAIVKNKDNMFLICLRPETVHQGGKWEFPGGKMEAGESAPQAMCRELQEEVGLVPLSYQLLEAKYFDYGDSQLYLHFYLVDTYSGEAKGQEGQPLKWVSKEELALYSFPDANKSIIEQL